MSEDKPKYTLFVVQHFNFLFPTNHLKLYYPPYPTKPIFTGRMVKGEKPEKTMRNHAREFLDAVFGVDNWEVVYLPTTGSNNEKVLKTACLSSLEYSPAAIPFDIIKEKYFKLFE